jgi:hypothetical protein
MPRMTDKETRLWQDRLLFAHRRWRDAGLTDDTNIVGALAWMNAYRAITWSEDWGGMDLSELIEVPTAFWVINTQMAELYARHPVLDVTADNPESHQAARRMEIVLNHMIRARQLGMKRQLNRALLSALTLQAGVLRHGFTPSEAFHDADGNLLETFQPARPNVPWIRNVPLWDFRADPDVESFHHRTDVRWCAFRSLVTDEEFDATPGLIRRKDLQATRSRRRTNLRSFDHSHPEEFSGGQPPEEDAKLIEVWTIYDRIERKWFGLSPGSQKTVREPEDWPIEWDGLPYNWLGFYEQLDSPFPIAPISQIRDLVLERNKVRTLMSQLVKRMRRILFVKENEVNPEDLDKLMAGDIDLTEIIRATGDDPVKEIRTGTLDPSLLAYDTQIEQDIRQTFGQSRMDRGERINVESGTEAAAVARGSQIQGGLLKGPWEDFVGDTLGTFGSALQTPGLLTGNITVPVLGTRDAQLLIQQLGGGPVNQLGTVSGERLRGSFLYEVRPNSMAPRDPLEDQRRAVANLEVAAKFGGNAVKMPQLLMDYWLAVDEDPGRVTMSPQEMQGADAVAAGMPKDEQGQKRNGQGGPIVPPQLLRSVR